MTLKVALQIKASGENVKYIQPSKNFTWHVKLISRDPSNSDCSTPPQITKNYIKIDSEKWVKSKVPGKSSELVNHNQKLAFDQASVSIMTDRLGVYEFDENNIDETDSANESSSSASLGNFWQTICVFRCDNCDLVDFQFEGVNMGWKIEAVNGTIFEDCEFEDGEWYDVDTNEDLVSITDFKWRFSKKSVGFEDESKYLIHYIENCLHIDGHHNRDD